MDVSSAPQEIFMCGTRSSASRTRQDPAILFFSDGRLRLRTSSGNGGVRRSAGVSSQALASVGCSRPVTLNTYSGTFPTSCFGQPNGLAWIKPDGVKSSAKTGGC